MKFMLKYAHKKTVLLVDADADCELLMLEAAARTDRAVLFAKTSREAFEILGQEIQNLDLVVVDVDPGAHGLALLEAISACAQRPPMIVVTALEETYMNSIAEKYGAAVCLGKPMRWPKLVDAIQEVSANRGLTCDRWGALVPAPAQKPAHLKSRFRGIAAKLSARDAGKTGASRP